MEHAVRPSETPSIDDIMVTCMARQIRAGDAVVQGLATPLATAAYMLARYTHAPDLYFASAIGQGMCRYPAPLSIRSIETLWLDRALSSIGFVRASVEILTSLHLKEFFRPAQVDCFGNFNNIAFGKDYRRPRLRMPGAGGIPDVTVFAQDVYLYVPRHSRATFVKQIDFCSGLGNNPLRTQGEGPSYLISDLGQFDFANGRLRLTSYHPGVSISSIQAHTGFELELADDIQESAVPADGELRLLQAEIDPVGIRNLESLSGASRRELLHGMPTQDAQQVTQAEASASRATAQ